MRPRAAWRRWLPLLLLVLAALGVYAAGLHRELSLASLRAHRDLLQELATSHPVLAPLAYVVLYVAAIALSLPGGTVLTLAGGFLFGTWLGGGLAILGATLGAVLVFLIARTALGNSLRAHAEPWLRRLEAGFRADAFTYLLVLRLVPLFPFWLVNLVPASLDVPLRTYLLATLIGIAPATLILAGVGHGLGTVLDRGGTPEPGLLLRPDILLPLLGLAGLALLPLLYRRWRRT